MFPQTAERSGVLTEAQMRLLRKARGRLVDPEQHIEAPHADYLLCQDTYFVGTIKGVLKIYQQTVIDAHDSHVFANPYLSKVPMTAVNVLRRSTKTTTWRGSQLPGWFSCAQSFLKQVLATEIDFHDCISGRIMCFERWQG